MKVRLVGLPSNPIVELRACDSDAFVASQVAGWKEYDIGMERVERLNGLAQSWIHSGIVPIVVDGGANVGISALFFADVFTKARVIAIEPDPDTFEIMRRNVASEPRIIPVHGALWSDGGGVEIQTRTDFSWSNQVCGTAAKESIPSTTLESLLAQVPNGRTLILKLDIEGAERKVCSVARSILRDVPCIMIEPHDFMIPGAGCLTPLLEALAGQERDTILCGENLVFIDSGLMKNIFEGLNHHTAVQ